MIKIFNDDCMNVMSTEIQPKSIDLIITSPPYNNSRTSHTEYCMKTLNVRYDEYNDNKTNEEYCEWIDNIFKQFDVIVKADGVVLWNVSYGSENPTVMFDSIHSICANTPWMIADIICWKKKSALPNNVSSNKCTRICEYVFVFCRKSEYTTFKTNKEVSSYSRTGQPFYTVMYNFIEADNNDGVNGLNNATFSTDLVIQLLDMYAVHNIDTVVFDPFMGTGTTAYACKKLGISCLGSELSSKQCEYAEKRLTYDNVVSTTAPKSADGLERFEWDL